MSYHTKNYTGGDFGVGKKRVDLQNNNGQIKNDLSTPIIPVNYHVHSNNAIYPSP